jgi:hypothetical protein
MTAIAQGQQFTYTASLYSTLVKGPDAIANEVAQNLSNQGYQVLNRKVDTGSVLGQITSFFGTSGINVAPFNVTFTIQDNNDGDDSGTAQFIADQMFEAATGQPVSSSSITVIGGQATGQPGQTEIASPGLGIGEALGLPSIPTWALILVAIIVILVVAVIISPTAPARIAASFA